MSCRFLKCKVRGGPIIKFDEILALLGDLELRAEAETGSFDLSVGLEGDVAANHVEQQDAQAPDGEAVGSVSSELDPLGGSVNSGS